MAVTQGASTQRAAGRHSLIGLLGCVGFSVVSLLGYATPLAVQLMVLTGLALPLAWGAVTREWGAMGFTRRNLSRALGWGVAAGLVTSVLGIVMIGERVPPARLGLELVVGIPLWLLAASPFQEFFFRGWLQSRWERGMGRGVGLVATTAVFTLWHYCWPLGAQSSFPLYTVKGLAATFAAGLVYGYSFQRTGNIVTPWLAHALAGVAFLCIGAGSFASALQR